MWLIGVLQARCFFSEGSCFTALMFLLSMSVVCQATVFLGCFEGKPRRSQPFEGVACFDITKGGHPILTHAPCCLSFLQAGVLRDSRFRGDDGAFKRYVPGPKTGGCLARKPKGMG